MAITAHIKPVCLPARSVLPSTLRLSKVGAMMAITGSGQPNVMSAIANLKTHGQQDLQIHPAAMLAGSAGIGVCKTCAKTNTMGLACGLCARRRAVHAQAKNIAFLGTQLRSTTTVSRYFMLMP